MLERGLQSCLSDFKSQIPIIISKNNITFKKHSKLLLMPPGCYIDTENHAWSAVDVTMPKRYKEERGMREMY